MAAVQTLQPFVELDDRAGSKDLAPHLRHRGLEIALTRLEYGDLSFDGSGPRGPVLVGVEYKTIRDLLASMRSGRLPGHQLPGMVRRYDYYYLIVEGIVRASDDGLLEVPRGGSWMALRNSASGPGYLWREFDGYLNSLEMRGGIKIRRTASIRDTAAQVDSLARWWIKPWDDHKSVGTSIFYQPPDTIGIASFAAPSLVRQVAALLPGIGWGKSAAVENKFKTVLDMVAADQRDWETIPGIGPTIGKRAVDSLRLRKGETE